MKTSVKILILTAAILLGAFNAPSQTAQYRLGLGYASSLYSNKEQFEFSIDGERVVLNAANPVVYFNKRK